MTAADAAGSATPPAHRVVRPDRSRLIESIGRLIAAKDRLPARRFLDHARRVGLPLDDLWSLEDTSGALLASALAIPGAGRIAMIFATRPEHDAEIELVAPVVDHAARAIAARDVTLAQALVDPCQAREHAVFRAAGFTELATLSYLDRRMPVPGEMASAELPPGCSTRAWNARRPDEMLRLLEATYDGTLDCPGLCGLRRTEDILEGHLQSGRYEAPLWTILDVGGEPAGVMLFSPALGGESVELVYFGLARAARGRGLGKALLLHGLARMAGRRERLVSLAVDESNEPALRIYRHVGFQQCGRRTAFVRPLAAIG